MRLFGRDRHGSAVDVVTRNSGMILQGDQDAIRNYADALQLVLDEEAAAPIETTCRLAEEAAQADPSPVPSPGGSLEPREAVKGRLSVLGVPLAIATSLVANVKGGATKDGAAKYVKFSPESMKLLEKHGAIPAGDGYFRSLVRDEKQIVGNLDWKTVSVNPDQALAFQAAATQMALSAAINDLTKAVERVEGKVDKIVKLLRAERLGKALGDQLTLQPMVEKVRSTGSISKTDWSTVDSLGALITRDVEVLRAYIRGEIEDSEATPIVNKRSGELKDLSDDLMGEALGLLLVVEANFMMWQELKFAHVATHEPEALAGMIDDSWAEVDAYAKADQALVDGMYGVATKLLEPSGYEAFTPLEARRLHKQTANLNEQLDWFCNQRHLDVGELVVNLPGLRETMAGIATQTKGGVSDLSHTAKATPGKVKELVTRQDPR